MNTVLIFFLMKALFQDTKSYRILDTTRVLYTCIRYETKEKDINKS